MNGKSWLSLMSGIVTGVAVLVCVLALAIETMGCSAGVMKALMLRDSPPEYSGLPEEEYSEMCTMITGYLSGAQKEFGYELEGQQLRDRLIKRKDSVFQFHNNTSLSFANNNMDYRTSAAYDSIRGG